MSCGAGRITIYGHVGFDISAISGKETQTFGGGAYYAALAASLSGASVDLVTAIGHDFPISRLRELGIDLSGTTLFDGPSALFYQRYDDVGNIVDFQARLNACEHLTTDQIPPTYFNSSAFLITTAPPPKQADVLQRLTELNFEGIVGIDTTLAYVSEFRTLLELIGTRIDILFANSEEFFALGSPTNVGKYVVVKRGPKGASVYAHGEWTDIPAANVAHVVSTTGAGDVLAGASLGHLVQGVGITRAVEAGVVLASQSVTGSGVEHLMRM